MSLLKPIATVGGFTLASRITGFARDMLIADRLGAGLVADAFFVAFKFPNLFRRLFAEGAFSAAFVPLFAGLSETEGPDKAKAFAEEALAVLFSGLLLFVALMQILMPWAMYIFAPGFAADPQKFDLAVALSRIAFPYLLFVSLVSLLGGVLNSIGRFAAAAAAPIFLNLGLMAALLGLTPLLSTPGHALAWGTTLAGVLQLALLLAACRRVGISLRLARPRLTPRVKTLLKRILPGAVGAGVYQVNLLVDTMIASLVGPGAVSFLYYADRVNQLPLGVVGTAVGTALLPLLSRQIRAGDRDAARASQNRALEFALLLTLPAMAGLFALAGPIVSVLFERGAFGPAESQATAAALSAFALGIPAYVLNKTLTPAFFAHEDTATPVKVAMLALVANIVFNLILMQPLAHVGIALSTALSAWVNVGVLLWLLRQRKYFAVDVRLRRRAPRILAVSLAMGFAVYAAQSLIAPAIPPHLAARALWLAALIGAGAVVFGMLALASGAASREDLARLRRRRPAPPADAA